MKLISLYFFFFFSLSLTMSFPVVISSGFCLVPYRSTKGGVLFLGVFSFALLSLW